jgi:dolichol-phosphate mannosyltransferase
MTKTAARSRPHRADAMVVGRAHEGLGLSLVLPTFNERSTLPQLIARLRSILDARLPADYELIVVDDDSPDRTWELAAEIAAEDPTVRLLRRVDERGLSSAVVAGWQMSRGRILGVIDADLQHPPETLVALIDRIMDGADLAVASRYVAGGGVSDWSVPRRLLSRGAQTLGLVLLPEVVGRISDPMSGYFLVSREAVADAPLRPLGYKILIEVLARGRVGRLAEVGYVFNERQHGSSKVTRRQYIEYVRHLLLLRWAAPLGWTSIFRSVPVVRLMRFGVVGTTGVVVDMLLLYLLSDPTMLGLGLTRSKIIAAEVAILNNFIWNDRWTFRDFSKTDPGFAAWVRRFLKFNLICLGGLALNVLLLNLLFNVVGLNRYVSNLIAIVLVTSWNFGVNRGLNWRTTAVRNAP